MLIDISEKEKTALSILLGLRQKFARAKRDKETYSAAEMHKMFSEVIDKINKNELRYLDTLAIAHTPSKQQDEIWGEVDKHIERSKIRRYPWNDVFGRSLTQEILFLKKTGMDVDEVYKTLSGDLRVQSFVDLHKGEKRKILENLRISIHARFGENNTAKRVEATEE